MSDLNKTQVVGLTIIFQLCPIPGSLANLEYVKDEFKQKLIFTELDITYVLRTLHINEMIHFKDDYVMLVGLTEKGTDYIGNLYETSGNFITE